MPDLGDLTFNGYVNKHKGVLKIPVTKHPTQGVQTGSSKHPNQNAPVKVPKK